MANVEYVQPSNILTLKHPLTGEKTVVNLEQLEECTDNQLVQIVQLGEMDIKYKRYSSIALKILRQRNEELRNRYLNVVLRY